MTFGMRFRCESRCEQGADTGGWSRNFAYDSYGNMWVSGSSGVPLAGNTPTSNVYSTANRISGSSYDASGNQLAVNGDTGTYDAENRLTTVSEPPSMGGGTETLVYDGSGQRVQKILPSPTTNYVYDAFGRLIAEYTTNPTESPCWTCYLTYDHLGSVRMVTSANLQFVARHDFLPFGEELPPNSAGRNAQWGPGADNITQKFTGQVRDEETDLDYFNARYFGAALGRFTSPDPRNAGANPMNPQSLNGYVYVLNNPLARTDFSGMDTNYAGLESGVCPASKANCPTIPNEPIVGTPTVPNEINLAEVSYTNNVRSMFGWVAGDSPSQIMAYAVAHPAAPDLKAIAKTFNAAAAHLPFTAGASYQVAFQVRGITYNIQIVVPNSPGQMVSFSSLNDASTGIVDPPTGFHGGNSSEYFGYDAFDVLHIADVSDPYGDVKQGLDAHIDQFNPIANPATFLFHFIIETVPFYFNPSGQRGIVTCVVGGGCRQ